jgi:hypothetical protein
MASPPMPEPYRMQEHHSIYTDEGIYTLCSHCWITHVWCCRDVPTMIVNDIGYYSSLLGQIVDARG